MTRNVSKSNIENILNFINLNTPKVWKHHTIYPFMEGIHSFSLASNGKVTSQELNPYLFIDTK